MKKFLSVILVVVLLLAVGSSVASGTMAGFFDTEVSTDNYMHAGYVNLTVDGQDDEEGDIIQPFEIGPMCPDKPYQEEIVLCNTGTIDGTVYIHFQNVEGHEAGTVDGEVWNGAAYVTGSPVGAGVASSEPELAAEEATSPLGYLDSTPVYATDDGTATGTLLLGADTANLEDYILVTIYWDEDGNGSFEDDERVELDSGQYTLPLSELDCNIITLGELGGDIPLSLTGKGGGGWGSYFAYDTGTNGEVVRPLIAGQRFIAGTVTVWYDGANLHVLFETDPGWTMTETQVYAKGEPPQRSGKKDWYKHEDLGGVSSDEHTIPIAPNTEIYIAAHAVVWTDGNEETAWAQGKCRKLKLQFVFPDISEEDFIHPEFGPMPLNLFPGTDPINHWPTNAYQGDYVTFDIEYTLEHP